MTTLTFARQRATTLLSLANSADAAATNYEARSPASARATELRHMQELYQREADNWQRMAMMLTA